MARAGGNTIKLLARLKAHWNTAFAAKLHQFLQTRSPRPARYQDTVQRAACTQRLPNRVNSHKQGH